MMLPLPSPAIGILLSSSSSPPASLLMSLTFDHDSNLLASCMSTNLALFLACHWPSPLLLLYSMHDSSVSLPICQTVISTEDGKLPISFRKFLCVNIQFCEHYSSSVKNNTTLFSNIVPAINKWKANDQNLTVTTMTLLNDLIFLGFVYST
jgi:hypothetical protein